MLIAGGYLFHDPMSVPHILLGAFMLTLTAAPYIGMTILFTSISGDNLRACLYSFGFMILTNKLDYFSDINPWFPESLMKAFVETHISMASIDFDFGNNNSRFDISN